MSNLKICLICLCKDVKMYNIDEYNLRLYYEEIMPPIEMDGLPQYFCFVCAAMLFKFHKFKEKCSIGQAALKTLLSKGPITLASLSQVDRQHLQSTINIMTVSKRVKTCVVENFINYTNIHENLDDITDYESDNSYDEKITEVEIEIEQDDNDKKDDIDEEIINIDEGKINDDDKPAVESSNEISVIKVTEDAKPDVKMKNYAMHMQAVVENAFKIESEKIEVVIIPEVVAEEKKRKEVKSRKNTRRKPQNKTEVIAKMKERKGGRKKGKETKQREFDPQFWYTRILTEEEAQERFKARAFDIKYMTARFKCTTCFTPFSKEEILAKHNRLVHSESRGNTICHFCNRRYKSRGPLKKHLPVHYHEYKCLRCNLVFHVMDSAARHDDSHNGFVKVCGHCGLQFKHLTTYYSHVRVYHRSEHVCSLCGASFFSHKGLSQHKTLKHTNVNKPSEESEGMYCVRCDMHFETKQAYEVHIHESIKHAGVEQPKDKTDDRDTDEETDDLLPALISLKGKVKNANPHLNRDNKTRGIKICPVCDKVFPSFYAYRLHHKAEHKDIPMGVDYRQICEVCGVTIKSNNIANHMNIHTREKLFPCPTCGVQFTMKANMMRHNLTHTVKDKSQYMFKCPLCEKRFTQKGSMQLHYRTKHLKEPYPKRNRKKKIQNEFEDAGVTSGHSVSSMY